MTSFTWAAGISGDWNTPARWLDNAVPNSSDAIVYIQFTGSYTIEISSGETDTANQVILANATDTLSVDGTLQFAGAMLPTTTQGQGTVVVGATGVIDGTGLFAPGAVSNRGTLIADGGDNTALEFLTGVTNYSVIAATDGNLEISALANLSNSVLTGGTYFVSGFIPANATTAPDNIIYFGLGASAGLQTDAADIVLDGPASLLDVFDSGGNFFSLEQELLIIATTGTLAVLGDRDYLTNNTLLDAGDLQLGGGTLVTGGLTVASGGTLSGYGLVSGPLMNAGAIIADGGSLGSFIFNSPHRAAVPLRSLTAAR